MDGPGIRAGRLAPESLASNFADLHPPLGEGEALVEAARCHFCHDAPCVEACPTGIDVPQFIRGILTGNLKGAALEILEANPLGGTCARVCPTEVLCEAACVRVAQEGKPVRIGALQRRATDWLMDRGVQPFARAPATGRRVAVVGAGPAGLACAHGLARAGHDVAVLEAKPRAGGLNEYGIAAYKMAGDFAAREVSFLLDVGGIEVRHGLALGRDFDLPSLRRDFDAVFLGVGLGAANPLGLPADQLALRGVRDAIRWIAELRQAPDKAAVPVGRDVVVVGGGNTAVDAAVQARRLGAARVTIAYRRGVEAMGATAFERDLARLEGVTLLARLRPARLLGDGAGALRAAVFEAVADAGDGRGLVATGELVEFVADQLLLAIGQAPEAHRPADLPERDARGRVTVDPDGATSIPGVWAGGDGVGPGPDLTVVAVEAGKRAAAAIRRHLQATG